MLEPWTIPIGSPYLQRRVSRIVTLEPVLMANISGDTVEAEMPCIPKILRESPGPKGAITG